jgi:hypothetical protein
METCKRIVVQHTQGMLAGLWQIVGLAELDDAHILPDSLSPIRLQALGEVRTTGASLIAVKPHYVHYREFWGAEHKGKLNDFHPSQV